MSTTSEEKKKLTNIIIGITGSVATIKLAELVRKLQEKLVDVNICVVPTKNSLKFCPDLNETFNKDLPELKDRLAFLKKRGRGGDRRVLAFVDEDEWTSWQGRSDPVLHIELRKWADACLIAPLDANTLAKISNGLCDNLLTSVLRAWDLEDIKSRPVVICPAMNTFMYTHPITKRQLNILANDFGFTLVDAIEKTLICGDVGMGAMAKVDDIVDRVAQVCQEAKNKDQS